jgi:hypothetical protein
LQLRSAREAASKTRRWVFRLPRRPNYRQKRPQRRHSRGSAHIDRAQFPAGRPRSTSSRYGR